MGEVRGGDGHGDGWDKCPRRSGEVGPLVPSSSPREEKCKGGWGFGLFRSTVVDEAYTDGCNPLSRPGPEPRVQTRDVGERTSLPRLQSGFLLESLQNK